MNIGNISSNKYNLADLQKIETVTIDMNTGYVSVIKELFPQTKIIVDRFHLVQLINRSMNKYRVTIMNKLKADPHDNMKKVPSLETLLETTP